MNIDTAYTYKRCSRDDSGGTKGRGCGRVAILAAAAAVMLSAAAARAARGPLVIDHNCTNLAGIPAAWIETAKDDCKWHFARMSHGRQINEGLEIIERSDPAYDAEWPYSGGALPEIPDALCIYTHPADPVDYWSGPGLEVTRAILAANPTINISMFCWCTQLDTASESYVAGYLQALSVLEAEFPGITFVYCTGTAEHDGGYGYNRWLRNEQIRRFCLENGKVLYDFADLDSWWFDPQTNLWERSTYPYNGYDIPVEHPQLAGNETCHTSYTSCEQKAKAAWWLIATLAGWEGASADVLFQRFVAESMMNTILLQWKIGSNGLFEGFNVYRSDDGGRTFRRINDAPLPPDPDGRFVDGDVAPGHTYTYRIGAIEGDTECISPPVSVRTSAESVQLYQNYPNPFNPSTRIAFYLLERAHVSLDVFDSCGVKVRSLVHGERETGPHAVVWKGENDRGRPLSSGVYYYKLRAGKRIETRKMIMVR